MTICRYDNIVTCEDTQKISYIKTLYVNSLLKKR